MSTRAAPWRFTARALATVLLVPLTTCVGAQADQDAAQHADQRAYPRVDHLNILPLGDSITCGYIPNPDRNACLSDGYRKDLWHRLYGVGLQPNMVGSCPDPTANCTGYGSGTFGDWNHEGHSGWTTPRLTGIVHERVTRYQPEVVLLHVGINDLAYGYATREQSLRGIIDTVRAAKPDVWLFVATITFDHRWTDRWDGYNKTVVQVVTSYNSPRVRLVRQDFVRDLAHDFNTVDKLHPSSCGYAKMAYFWYDALERSPVNATGEDWPTGYYPGDYTKPGPCQTWRR